MPKSKSKSSAPAARLGGLPKHPALNNPHPVLHHRLKPTEEGFRLPDKNLEPTAVTVLVDNYTIASGATGECCFMEYPFLQRQNGNTGTSPMSIGQITRSVQADALTAVAAAARVNAIRIEVTYIGAELNASGYLSYVRRRAETALTGVTVDSFHPIADKQVRAQEGMVITGMPYADCDINPAPAGYHTTGFMANAMHAHVFAASGLPISTNCFRVRVQRYVEYLPKEGDLSEGSLQSEPHDEAAMVALQHAAPVNHSVHTHAGTKDHFASITNVINAAYHMAQPFMPYVVPRARQYLAASIARAAPLMLTM